MVRVYCPSSRYCGNSRHTRGVMRGKGIGTMLLDGGIGGGSSYESIDDYIATTGRNPNIASMGTRTGRGLGSISSKLESLQVKNQKTKPKNIKFHL